MKDGPVWDGPVSDSPVGGAQSQTMNARLTPATAGATVTSSPPACTP